MRPRKGWGIAAILLLSLILSLVLVDSAEARRTRVTGPNGGTAVRGPYGAAAVGPNGAAAVRGPRGGAAAVGPNGGTAVRTPAPYPYRGPYPYRAPYPAAPYAAGVATGVAVGAAVAYGTRVTVLPAGCSTVVVNGIVYQHCGTVYYQTTVTSGKTVYVVVAPPK